jgi:hypothetical protein
VLLVLALEAAYNSGEEPLADDQISFGRIRIRIDAPVAGTYTVTHPYGVKIYPNKQAGTKAINDTVDIGVAVGNFEGALTSSIGPFLQAADSPGGTPKDYITVGGDTFLADPGIPEFVTGSPFGTNFFQICVDNPGGLDGQGDNQDACQTYSQFSLLGKVHTESIPSPLAVERATYSRNDNGAHVEVYATAKPGPLAKVPRLFFGDAGGTDLMPSTLMKGPLGPGGDLYYGQSIPVSANILPASVIVTNAADDPPSSIIRSLVDEVKIVNSFYNPSNGDLTIVATSSDKTSPPQLFAIGLPGSATGSDQLVLSDPGAANDPARKKLVYKILPPGNLRMPHLAINVVSSAGGQDTEAVSTFRTGGVFEAGGPVAIDDNVSVAAGANTAIPIAVLANDAGFDPSTVRIVSGAQNGTLAVNRTTGVVTYTFTDNTLVGEDSFTYVVRTAPVPGGMRSNLATVTVTTTAP